MEDFFKKARTPPVEDGAIPGFPSAMLLRIPGSRPRAYLLARSTSVSVAEESGKPSHFHLHLSAIDVLAAPGARPGGRCEKVWLPCVMPIRFRECVISACFSMLLCCDN